ncbi:glycosyltransferase family 4 protein [Micrococcales bacterium 31B]|nr:glycosyltransferase family 4 protein [Micrococcales bacterium 31B]
MRIGIVSPYDFDVPGGVQNHILQMAASLRRRADEVAVLGPGKFTEVPGVTCTGRSVAVPYNGSVARLAFGPRVARTVRAWLDAHRFDIVHIHEPATPSVSLIALHAATVPVVATFHSAQVRSRALHLAYPTLRPVMERLGARIAVSEEARRTVVEHLGGDALVIPNGVDVAPYRAAPVREDWAGLRRGGSRPSIAFLGRVDEPRKGLHVLAAASRAVRAVCPDARFLVAGRGSADSLAGFGPGGAEWLGPLSEADKASLLASADVYVAPQLGGESFGIVLIEAMSAGCPIVASDLAAFRAVLRDGRDGAMFRVGDATALARALTETLSDLAGSQSRAAEAQGQVDRFDWEQVGRDVRHVYDIALGGWEPDPLAPTVGRTSTRLGPDGVP